MATKTKMPRRVCYVVCYRDPNYTRTASLVGALELVDGIQLKVVRNKNRGLLRYVEVPLKLMAARLSFRPDTFVVGFRANEIFWALYPSMLGKKIIFDEFVNLHDWLIDEHKKIKAGSFAAKTIDAYMSWVAKRSDMILTDTKAHASLAVKVYNVPANKLLPVPVGADETIFKPLPAPANKKFEVFYYGTTLPLHGVPVILEAIKQVAAQNPNVHLSLVGGRGNAGYLNMVEEFVNRNNLSNSITLEPWVNYDALPGRIAGADLCLGGPFGNTGQARRVVSGKTYQFLACGRPTVIGKIDEATDFKDKQNCLLVEQGAAEKLAQAILWACQNKAKTQQIGKKGRELFEQQFSARAISKLLEQKALT